jgi:hypothetical protein
MCEMAWLPSRAKPLYVRVACACDYRRDCGEDVRNAAVAIQSGTTVRSKVTCASGFCEKCDRNV